MIVFRLIGVFFIIIILIFMIWKYGWRVNCLVKFVKFCGLILFIMFCCWIVFVW